MRQVWIALVVANSVVASGLALCASARAEVFILANGSQIEGELLNPNESPRQNYVIKLPSGTLTLDQKQVTKVNAGHPGDKEYDQIKKNYPDTVEGHWQLAEWCRERNLAAHREENLRRILELDPEHVLARRGLKYTKVQGEWKTKDEIMAGKGYVKYKGEWRLQQDVQLTEERRQVDLASKAWYEKIKRWRAWLNSKRADEAMRNFAEVNDPAALPAILAAFETSSGDERKMFLNMLARMDSPRARSELARCSLLDADEDIRLTCLEKLAAGPHGDIFEFYIKSLGDKENVTVNRAAHALQQLGDDSAIPALVEALYTNHKFKISSANPGSTTSTFTNGPGGSGGSFTAGGGPQIITRRIANNSVLDALVVLSGGIDFQYDQASWKAWLATQKKPTQLDARRN